MVRVQRSEDGGSLENETGVDHVAGHDDSHDEERVKSVAWSL